MARTAIISPNPASRVWRGRCVPRSRSSRAPPAKCRPPRGSSAADKPRSRRRGPMPVYTVHAPVATDASIAATDKFTFVRDGFHVWAFVFGPLWLVANRLWLALVGWMVALAAIDFAMTALGASGGGGFPGDGVV